MPSQSERHACKICGSDAIEFLFKAGDNNRQVDERLFDIMRCRACGVGFTVPKLTPEELSAYYTREYYSLDNNVALEEASRPYNRERVRRIRRFVNKGRLLDIGAGTGMFVKAAAESGFDVEGLELSEEAARFGREQWCLNIRQGNLYEIALSPETFDVVTVAHVYEHLHQPRAAAELFYSILKPGGLLVVAVPNFGSIQAYIFRSRWFHLDVSRHLFHYNPSVIERILKGVVL